ncbi:MAG: hypothetical protein IT460_07100 [Planctomycetes bacterium]|nr:hypothetical protein [Planctomycetota bacterium]
MREPAVPCLALCAAALLAPAALAQPLGPWPTAPAAIAAALALLAAGAAPIVLGATRHARPRTVLDALLVAAPAAYAVSRASPAPLVVPWAFVATAVALALVATAAAGRVRAVGVVAAAALVAALPAADAAGVLRVPTTLRAPTAPLAFAAGVATGPAVERGALVPRAWRRVDPSSPRRVGCYARRPDDAAGSEGTPPGAEARFLAVPEGAAADLPRAGTVVGAWSRALPEAGPAEVALALVPPRADDPRDLEAFDVVWAGPDTPDDPRAAATVASFVRRGGVLWLTESPEHTPSSLRRALGAAWPDAPGPAGARSLGAGRVVRVPDAAAVAAARAARLDRPWIATVLDRALEPPALPPALRPDAADPATGRAPLRTALLATLVLAWAAAALAGRRRTVTLAVLAAAAVGTLAVGPASPRAPAVAAFALEVGGVGGRRVEGVVVVAGPAGYLASTDPSAPADALRVLGFRVVRDGASLRLSLPPGGEGWVVADAVAGLPPTDAERVTAPPGWADGLFERPGGASGMGVETGRSGLSALRWPGVAPEGSVPTVVVRPQGP